MILLKLVGKKSVNQVHSGEHIPESTELIVTSWVFIPNETAACAIPASTADLSISRHQTARFGTLASATNTFFPVSPDTSDAAEICSDNFQKDKGFEAALTTA